MVQRRGGCVCVVSPRAQREGFLHPLRLGDVPTPTSATTGFCGQPGSINVPTPGGATTGFPGHPQRTRCPSQDSRRVPLRPIVRLPSHPAVSISENPGMVWRVQGFERQTPRQEVTSLDLVRPEQRASQCRARPIPPPRATPQVKATLFPQPDVASTERVTGADCFQSRSWSRRCPLGSFRGGIFLWDAL